MESSNLLLEEISIDDIINQIGLGKYHYRMYSLIFFNFLQQNTQNIIPGIILPAISKEFNLTSIDKSIYGTFEFLGFLFSSLFVPKLSKSLGQRKALIIFQVFWFFSMILSLFATNIYFFSVCRLITSFSHMIVALIGFALLSEISPQNFRGVAINFVGVASSLAFLLTCLLGLIMFDDLENANWRLFIGLFAIFLFVSLIINFFYLENSARFDLFAGFQKKSIDTLNKMAKENLKNEEFVNNEKKLQLINWYSNFNNKMQNIFTGERDFMKQTYFQSVQNLFSGPYKKITVIMICSWVVVQCTNFGTDFILALTLKDISLESGSKPLWLFFDVNAIVFPFTFLIIYLGESRYFGRKKTLSLFFFLTGLSNILGYFNYFPNTIFWLCVSKISLRGTSTVIYLFTTELYPTSMRINALGNLSAVCRVAVIINSWVSLFLLEINPMYPFFLYGLMGFIGYFTLNLLPYETRKENLERIIEFK